MVALCTCTFWTLQVPHDEIATRVGWAMQDWDKVATQSSNSDTPFLMFVAACYLALDEFLKVAAPTSTIHTRWDIDSHKSAN